MHSALLSRICDKQAAYLSQASSSRHHSTGHGCCEQFIITDIPNWISCGAWAVIRLEIGEFWTVKMLPGLCRINQRTSPPPPMIGATSVSLWSVGSNVILPRTWCFIKFSPSLGFVDCLQQHPSIRKTLRVLLGKMIYRIGFVDSVLKFAGNHRTHTDKHTECASCCANYLAVPASSLQIFTACNGRCIPIALDFTFTGTFYNVVVEPHIVEWTILLR